MNPKYQIFISSTYEDLKEERDQVTKATLEMGHIPVGMEMFNAGNEDQWQTIKRTIDQCDYYAIILARRYGSLDDDGISYTEKEYHYAVSIGVPVMGFVLDGSAAWPENRRDDGDAATRAMKAEKLEEFRGKVRSRIVNHWKNGDELQARFIASLSKIIVSNPRPGWVQATNALSPETTSELARLSKENSELRAKLSANETVVFAPKIELKAWISWDSWTDYSSPVNDGTQKRESKQGYRLYVQVVNVGNLVCNEAIVRIGFSMIILDSTTPKMWERFEDGIYQDQIKLMKLDLKGGFDNWVQTPLLPGQSKIEKYEIVESAVETRTDWSVLYSTHPDQGFATEGEIPFEQIEIRSRKPAPVPAPDSIA